jgi:hypothetical protein
MIADMESAPDSTAVTPNWKRCESPTRENQDITFHLQLFQALVIDRRVNMGSFSMESFKNVKISFRTSQIDDERFLSS